MAEAPPGLDFMSQSGPDVEIVFESDSEEAVDFEEGRSERSGQYASNIREAPILIGREKAAMSRSLIYPRLPRTIFEEFMRTGSRNLQNVSFISRWSIASAR